MLSFLIRRVILGVAIVGALSVASFCFFASQTDPYRQSPLLPQYWTWLRGVWTGASLHPLGPGGSIFVALAHTMALLAGTLLLVIVFSVLLAVLAARAPGSVADVVLRILAYAAWGIPAFLLAFLVQQLVQHFGSDHGIGPLPLDGWPGSCPPGIGLDYGTLSCPPAGSGLTYIGNLARYLMLPVLTLSAAFVGVHARQLRAALLDALGSPYIVTARAKGLSQQRVLVRHALRNSLATFAGGLLADFGTVYGAALAVDYIFQLNGLGYVFIHLFPTEGAYINVYALQLVLVLTALLVVASSLLGELVLVALDPRQRERR